MAAARPSRPDSELRAAAVHLNYEIDMMTRVFQALITRGPETPQWLTNALLESFVVHFRSLSDVFYPGSNVKVDDVLASDFFDDPASWDKLRPTLSEEFATARGRANKEIAHLTYARLSVLEEAKAWNIAALGEEMERVISTFRSAVPAQRFS
jgi:hypothetical protein